MNYSLIKGENHVCLHLVDYLVDRTIEIPLTAFLPNQTPEVIDIVPLISFSTLHNKTWKRNFSRTKKNNNTLFVKHFVKYCECSATCCQTTSPHLLNVFFFRKSLPFILSIIQLLHCRGWNAFLVIFLSCYLVSPISLIPFYSKSYHFFLKLIFSKNPELTSPEK